MLDIALLGTGGGMPMPNRFLSSLLIKYKGKNILIDCGEGTQVSMRVLKWGFKSIDMICITHGHGDHIFGLPGLLSTIGNSQRTDPITIIGPKGIKRIVNGLIIATPYLPYDIDIVEDPKAFLGIDFLSKGVAVEEINQKDIYNKDMIISTLKLDHSSPCIGYSLYIPRKPRFYVDKAITNGVPKKIWKKLQNGETIIHKGKTYEPSMVLGETRKGIKLCYITDTRPMDIIPEFVKDSNLFVCEGTYGDDRDWEKALKNKHMTFSEAAELANKGNVDELLLTHFSPSMDEPEIYKQNGKNIFNNTIIGYDGFTKTLSFKEE